MADWCATLLLTFSGAGLVQRKSASDGSDGGDGDGGPSARGGRGRSGPRKDYSALDEKVQRRLAQNREAARKSRQRKKDYMKQLEVEVYCRHCPPTDCQVMPRIKQRNTRQLRLQSPKWAITRACRWFCIDASIAVPGRYKSNI